ncbi:MAG: outer membrane protein assembly factor BamE [Gammaproteobacteria bacterium]
MRFLRYPLLLIALATSACVYRIDIKQGNFIAPEKVAQVTQGMSEAQVRALLGPPMIEDPFHPQRWDYVYYNQPSSLAGGQALARAHVVVLFRDGKVASVEKKLLPAAAPTPPPTLTTAPTATSG